MVKRFEVQRVGLCIYKYKNLTIKYIVILGKFFKKLFFFGKKTLKNLSTCIKNSFKWTNPNYNPAQEYVTNVKIDKIIYSSYTGPL